MIDIGAISGSLASLKAAKDIAEGLISLRDTAKFQAAVVDLQRKILSAQSDQFALLERVRELEDQTAKLEAWNAEKQRYRLKDFGGNTFAYELQPEAADGEPMHRICPNCYQNGHKSILQFDFRTAALQDRYKCPGCNKHFELGNRVSRQPRAASGSART